MKKLIGMKKSFSSLENKKLKDLKSIQGGLLAGGALGSSRSASSNAGGNWDQDYYTDDTAGEWKWAGRHTLSFD